MQIPVLNGIYTNEASDFRTSYPRNLIPVPKQNGISNGYLRPADGVVSFATGLGVDRGGINWNGVCYRVSGTKLISIDASGAVTEIGDVGGTGQVSMDYSFDRLAIVSGGNLFYWDGTTFTQVVDPDLGYVISVKFVDGYFMLTDGEFLIITELTDPTQIDPLKYGSSEIDPDKVVSIKKIRNEPHAVNRYSIEAFDNIGGELFPFQRIEGAQITRGAISESAVCEFNDTLAFIGGKRNEPLAVWIGVNGSTTKISTREIDQILKEFTEDELLSSVIEPRIDDSHQFLYCHLPDRTLVYDAAGSSVVGQPVWFILTSGIGDTGQLQYRNIVWCYDKWIVGDVNSSRIGTLATETASHYGNKVSWEFGTTIIYNEGRGAIFHELELVCLSGRSELGIDDSISTEYSTDGETWSQPKYIKAGKQGERNKRLHWLQQGFMRNWRIQRFKGTSDSMLSIVRLEARLEPLAF